ncbi:ParB/RepB/Spo0J family partition protein [Yoonia sp.]|uniref:ParB/RepB/Spo0J family partition protein n=1 Tax=Yoonia sp. TaxID=2212373 RepID=UPI0039194413
MVKKRSVFDINFEPENDEGFPAGNMPPLETKSSNVQGHPLQDREPVPARRGLMASAIAETADATAERASAEAAIRADNYALAHEHVRLKKLGLITDLIQTSDVLMSKLTRDRYANADPDLVELKESIKSVGLSNPIRVEQTADGFELIQGYRRLTAFRELAEETGDTRYTRIPAAMVPRGEPLDTLYRKMVDENLIRKDLSFGEMAQLTLAYARDEGVSSGDAVSALYASALKQKRTYIRQFARVLEALDGAVRYPEAIPRALGLDLYKVIEAEPERPANITAALHDLPHRHADQEMQILRDSLTAPKKPTQAMPAKTMSKTSLRLGRPEGVTASDGKIELRLNLDFRRFPDPDCSRGLSRFWRRWTRMARIPAFLILPQS